MKTKFFLSWSGQNSRSHDLARALHDWLPKVIQVLDPRFSDDFLKPGQIWSKSLAIELDECRIGIFCLTPENLKSPWMLFEAGVFLRGERVCPLLLGLDPGALKNLPYAQFQALSFNSVGVFKLIQNLNQTLAAEQRLKDKHLDEVFLAHWPALDKDIKTILSKEVEGESPILEEVLQVLKTNGLMHSGYKFSNGFESPALYTAVSNLAKKRLFILGRKNRKFFDKGYKAFFDKLPDKLKNGFQFRVLFLDPKSPDNILNSAQQLDDFKSELEKCVASGKKYLEQRGIKASDHCRAYSSQRNSAIIVADDLVLHCSSIVDSAGLAKPLTDASFSVINANSPCGKELLDSFESFWNSAKPI
jgi:hypothetical protein